MPGLVGTGTKRKRDDGEDGVEGSHRLATCSQVCSYTLQRQCVLNLSACKLQMSRQQIEPPLRRSVLICNTLRHIERELRAEGRHYDCSRVSMLISNQPLCMDAPNKESIPSSHDSSNNSSSSPAESRGCLNERSRASSENTCPAVQRCAQPLADKCSLSLSDSRLQADSVETAKTDVSHENNNCLPSIANKTTMPSHLDTAPQPTNTLTRLTDKLSRDTIKQEINSCLDMTTTPTLNAASTDIMEFGDEIFEDIDVSLYDFDLASPFIPTHTPNPNPKPPSPSSNSEDWIRSFQGDMAGLDVSSTGAQGNCRSDLMHVDELDQIMHILVDVGM
ncbi:SERTA domain-containing protein 2-like [Lytechinus pictus]|uniref:SERTA domain-containing protein 2-like n=1 Tax=Lytechinus pictus TaxID=7653 RepID=UPI00240DDBE8|nr:SERTA domain-containing protein 2-like [Lytechinus pictus]